MQSARSFQIICALSSIVMGYSVAYSQRGQQPGQTWEVPQGTVIKLRMDTTLSSSTARAGDKFAATVTIPVYVDGKQVILPGSVIEGRVTAATPAKRQSKSGSISVDFDELVFPNGSRMKVDGGLTAASMEEGQEIDEEGRVSGDTGNRTKVFVGAGTVAGVVLGGVRGGGKGAAVGGAVGAGAGIAGVLLSKGVEAEVGPGTEFGLRLNQPLVISEGNLSERTGSRSESRPAPRHDAEPASEPARGDSVLPLDSSEMIRRAQTALKDQGYYEGKIDGVMGPRTATALRTYQAEHSLAETGRLDPDTAQSLGIVSGGGAVRRQQPPPQPAPAAATQPPPAPVPVASSSTRISAEAEWLVSDYKRSLRNRSQYSDSEIALLFALASFAQSAAVYDGLVPSISDRETLRRATVALAREARRADRTVTTVAVPPGQGTIDGWERVRQAVLSLMNTYGISASEIED